MERNNDNDLSLSLLDICKQLVPMCEEKKYDEYQEPLCGTCEWFNGENGDGQQFCDELENYVSENFYCNKYSKR